MKKSLEFNRSNSTVALAKTLEEIKRLAKPGLLVLAILTLSICGAPSATRAASFAVSVSVGIAPPPIPVYTQPICPGPGYMWTPGYWAYDPDEGYYWIPGTWVMAPEPGFLWTPGYWGWGGSAFIWHGGYWGPHVGFYGGVNYGFGYDGIGFVGGEWRGHNFFYNRAVVNIGREHITNVYYRRVENHYYGGNRVSYNGGRGGIDMRPRREEIAAEHDRHVQYTSMQRQHEMAAHNDRSQFVAVNHGAPAVAATGRPGEFRGAGAVRATRAGGPINESAYHGNHPGGHAESNNPIPRGEGNRAIGNTDRASHNEYSRGPHNAVPTQPGPAAGGIHSAPPSHPSHGPGAEPASPSRPPNRGPNSELSHPSRPSHGAPAAQAASPSRPSYRGPNSELSHPSRPSHGAPAAQAASPSRPSYRGSNSELSHSSRPSHGAPGGEAARPSRPSNSQPPQHGPAAPHQAQAPQHPQQGGGGRRESGEHR